MMTTLLRARALEHITEAFQSLWYDRYDTSMESGDMVLTPDRFLSMLEELTTPEEFEFTTFPSKSDEIVVVQDIPFVTLCAHHVLPFTGVAHIGYIPDGKIAGLSKLARTVEYYSKGLNVQEELTNKVAEYICEQLEPKGVAVVLKAEHTCMTIRGIKAIGSITTTSVMRGFFADHTRLARSEFFNLIGM